MGLGVAGPRFKSCSPVESPVVEGFGDNKRRPPHPVLTEASDGGLRRGEPIEGLYNELQAGG